jgi:hypothetical protein
MNRFFSAGEFDPYGAGNGFTAGGSSSNFTTGGSSNNWESAYAKAGDYMNAALGNRAAAGREFLGAGTQVMSTKIMADAQRDAAEIQAKAAEKARQKQNAGGFLGKALGGLGLVSNLIPGGQVAGKVLTGLSGLVG